MSDVWQVSLTVPTAAVAAVEEAFDGIGFSQSSMEVPGGREWTVSALLHEAPDEDEIRAQVMPMVEALGLGELPLVIETVQDRDWVSHTNKLLAPFRAGRFFLYGQHDRGSAPPGARALEIDAAQAFGTGRAPSTFGCLQAIDDLARRRCTHGGLGKVLDLGCGSGVLGLAAALAGAGSVVASDIDPVAARIAADNVRLNRLSHRMRVVAADGTRDALIQGGAPYDLVVANILAKPLTRLAPAIAGLVAPGGFVVLSGLLAREEVAVRTAYKAQGLSLFRRIAREGWHTLVLRSGVRGPSVL